MIFFWFKVHCVHTVGLNIIKYSMTSDEDGVQMKFKSTLEPLLDIRCSDSQSLLKFGNWVIAQFRSKKSSRHFVGQVIEEIDAEDTISIKFLKKVGSSFQWPEQDDISVVDKHDVVAVLSEPQIDGRGHLSFSDNLSKYGY